MSKSRVPSFSKAERAACSRKTSPAEAKRKVWEMIREVEVAMMVTQDEEGRFRGRPMRASQKEFDGVLWFFTPAGSPKTGEVAEDERCLLAYSDPRSQNYVSIYGTAELVRDVFARNFGMPSTGASRPSAPAKSVVTPSAVCS